MEEGGGPRRGTKASGRTAAERRCWLALARVPGLHAGTLGLLLGRFGSATALCAASPAALRDAGLGARAALTLSRPLDTLIAADEAWLAHPRHDLIALGSPRYPPLLAEVADAPVALFTCGDAALLCEPQVAVVGTRRPSPVGLTLAGELASGLADAGMIVTSGLALGVDAAAHRAALARGRPTIAVLGCGPDVAYPRRHCRLALDIAASGLLVSEFPPGTPPLAAHFPRRNRVISGLSLGVLVVEAARRSGSLITARLAAEQGRDVFAVPGSVRNPVSAGCHALLRDGAILVESVCDVLRELQPGLQAVAPRAAPDKSPSAGLAADERRVLSAVGFEPTVMDELLRRTMLTPQDLCPILLGLEMAGLIAARPGGSYQRTGDAA